MRKLVVVSLLGFASTVFGQKLPIKIIESGCENGKARMIVENIGTYRIDSIQAHFEGPAIVTMKKAVQIGGMNLMSQPCGCKEKGKMIGVVVYPGRLVIGRDEW